MATCIYYKERLDLHFDSGEHVIPAAIGGRSKLPPDYVSKEFNNDISKVEREVIQRSIVSMPREIEGPGKRGKLTEKHETKSEVMVLGNANDPKMFALGYVKKGIGHEISQVIYDTDSGIGQVRVHSPAEIQEFKDRCSYVDIRRLRTIIDRTLPDNIVIFGIEEGVEPHFDIFFAKNITNELTLTAEIIKQFGEGIKTHPTGQRETYQPIFGKKVVFDADHFRVYGKIAFNFMALRFGKEFALRSEFDPLRVWIAQGGENRFASLSPTGADPLMKALIKMPEWSHFVFIARRKDRILLAKVILYGALCVDIVLSHDFTEEFALQGFICDWKEQKEYLLDKSTNVLVEL